MKARNKLYAEQLAAADAAQKKADDAQKKADDAAAAPTWVERRKFIPTPQTLAGMTPFQAYMYEQHGKTVGTDANEEDYPNIAFTQAGKLALYGDDALEKRLNLPEQIKAIQTSNGIIHEVFDPSVQMPKFIGTHDVDQPHQELILVH